jgi:hypothetical protein
MAPPENICARRAAQQVAHQTFRRVQARLGQGVKRIDMQRAALHSRFKALKVLRAQPQVIFQDGAAACNSQLLKARLALQKIERAIERLDERALRLKGRRGAMALRERAEDVPMVASVALVHSVGFR